MRFLIDMPLSPTLVNRLQDQGHDACHASEVGLWRAADVVIVERARTDDRVIITADLHYPQILALTRAEEPGLILFRGGEYSEDEIRERLDTTFRMVGPEALRHSIIVIEKTRIRRRRLPIE